MELNTNDLRVLDFCIDESKTVTEISKNLDIALKNASLRISKLKSMGLLTDKDVPIGKPKEIKTSASGIRNLSDSLKVLSYLNTLDKKGLIPTIETMKKSFENEEINIEEIVGFLQQNKYAGVSITSQGKDYLRKLK